MTINIEEIKEEYLRMKEELALTERRTIATKAREIRKVSDELYVLKNSLNSILKDRKITLTEVQNHILIVDEIISVLRKAGLYTDPM